MAASVIRHAIHHVTVKTQQFSGVSVLWVVAVDFRSCAHIEFALRISVDEFCPSWSGRMSYKQSVSIEAEDTLVTNRTPGDAIVALAQ